MDMMTEGKKALITELKKFVSAVEEKENLSSKYYKLKYDSSAPQKPTPPNPINPTIKRKELIPQDSKRLVKSVLLWGIEIAAAIFLIVCFLNGSNKELGFGGTMLIMLGTPVSIVALVIFGRKIKKNKGISSYMAAKKENERKKQYNKRHEKEIEEALRIEKNRYEKEIELYNEEIKKYNEEVFFPMKECEESISKFEASIKTYEESFEEAIGKRLYLGRNFHTISSSVAQLFKYYIALLEENNECNIDSFEAFIRDVALRINNHGEEEEELEKILTEMRQHDTIVQQRIRQLRENLEVQRKEQRQQRREEQRQRQEDITREREAEEKIKKMQKEEELKQKRKAEQARTKCYHCKHYNTCTVKGRIDCPMYVMKF